MDTFGLGMGKFGLGDNQSDNDDPAVEIAEGSFQPHFNIDGTLMLGDFDINGRPYGITDWTEAD